MYASKKKSQTTTSRVTKTNISIQKKANPIINTLNVNQSLVIQKKREFIPNTGEPHLHIHRRGITYTDTRHRHKDLRVGNQDRPNAVRAVLAELRALAAGGNPNAQPIIDYITENFS